MEQVVYKAKITTHDSLHDAMIDNYDWEWHEYITIPLSRFVYNVKFKIKSFIQKIRYGFPDYEWYDFKNSTANYIVPRLQALREKARSVPMGLKEEEWATILDKIIWSFKNIDNQPSVDYSDNYDHRYLKTVKEDGSVTLQSMNVEGTASFDSINKHNEKIQEGLNLFAEYYRDLWS